VASWTARLKDLDRRHKPNLRRVCVAAWYHTRPLRVTSEPRRPIRYRTFTVEVLGDQVFGDAPVSLRENARRLAAALEIGWGVFVFYSRKRTSFN